MAKEKPRCVICGQETDFFRRATLPFYNTNQIVCSDCRQRYDSASSQEKARLKEQILNSPHLWERERIESLLKWKQEEEERRLSREKVSVLKAAHREQAIHCCGQKMTCLGTSQFQLGEHSILLGDLSHLLAGSLQMTVYQCEMCGQIKFFKPLAEEE